MSLVQRSVVDGTEKPRLHIGKRLVPGRDGEVAPSRNYSVEWFADGKQHRRALGVSNKQAAIRAAHALHAKLRAGVAVGAGPDLQVNDLLARYLSAISAMGRAARTIGKYKWVLEQFGAHAAGMGVSRVAKVRKETLWSFRQSLIDGGVSAKTAYDRVVIVQQAFKWAEQDELIERSPLKGLRLRKPEGRPQPCFAPDEVVRLLAAADQSHKPVFAFLAYTGARFGEMRDLLWEDIDLARGFVTIRRGGSSGETKNRRVRRIPIHPELRPLLAAVPRRGARVFCAGASMKHPEADGPLDERRLLRSLKRLCRRCGLQDPDRYKLHTFRHAFASMLARNQTSYKYALEFMGHSSSEILDLYYTMFDADAVRAIASIDYGASEGVAA